MSRSHLSLEHQRRFTSLFSAVEVHRNPSYISLHAVRAVSLVFAPSIRQTHVFSSLCVAYQLLNMSKTIHCPSYIQMSNSLVNVTATIKWTHLWILRYILRQRNENSLILHIWHYTAYCWRWCASRARCFQGRSTFHGLRWSRTWRIFLRQQSATYCAGISGPNLQTILGQSWDNFQTHDNFMIYLKTKSYDHLLDVLRQLGSDSQDRPIVLRFILKYIIW